MIKYTITLMLLMFCAAYSKAQTAYYDAVKLVESQWAVFSPAINKIEIIPTQANAEQVIKLFSRYLTPQQRVEMNNKPTAGEKLDIIKAAFLNNPFIEISTTVQEDALEATRITSKVGTGGLVGAVSGLNVTNFADGLAQFMVGRAKEELNVAFFERFKKYLEKHEEAKVLFPKTSDFLPNILASEYTQMFGKLRDVFLEDLKNLIYNLNNVFLLPKYSHIPKDVPEIPIIIRSLQIIKDLDDAKHPAEVIREFKDMEEWNYVDPAPGKKLGLKNFQSFLKIDYIISEALRFKDTTFVLSRQFNQRLVQHPKMLIRETLDHGTVMATDTLKTWAKRAWLPAREFEVLFNHGSRLMLFLGFIYRQVIMEDIKFYIGGTTIDFSTILANYKSNEKDKDRLYVLQSYIFDFVKLGEAVDQSYQDIRTKQRNGVEIAREDYYNYINTSIDVVEYGFKLGNLIHDKDGKSPTDAAEYIQIARNANSLYRNIYEKEYGSAVSNAVIVLERVSMLLKDPADENNAFTQLTGKTAKLLEYGTFMAGVVDAESPDDVKRAIEAVALPVGSSSFKKYQVFSVSLNSYLGAQLRLDNPEIQRSWDQRLGVIAPVGVALNWGFKKYGSLSILGSLIDVGAIAQFRLKDGDSELDEEIKLGNIFSPGGYAVYGFGGNLPLAFGVGGQYGPGLFKVDSNGGGNSNTVIDPSWRWNVFLAVDMPLFHLYKGKRKVLRSESMAR